MLFSRLITVFFTILACFVGGCAQKERPIDRATQEGILLVGNGMEPVSLDPQKSSTVNELRLSLALFEGLVKLDPITLEPIGAIALDWEISDDGCTYTFILNPQARFSNGEPITAADFLFSYERILNPHSTSVNVPFFENIVGAQAYHAGEAHDFETVGIHSSEMCRLVITLKEPVPYFLTLLAHPAFSVLNSACVKTYADSWATVPNGVFSGPFRLKSWKINDVIEVEKNPNYWNALAVGLNGIRFFPIDSAHTEEQAFLAGKLHITNSVPAHRVEHYRLLEGSFFHNHSYLAIDFNCFNPERPPLNDVRVRRALALSLDRQSLVENVLRRGQLPARNLVPPGTGGYTYHAPFEENVAEAQALLAEAGYPHGHGFPVLTLSYNNSDERRLVSQAIQGMWKEHLGIDIKLENQEAKTFWQARRQGDFDICRGGWVGDYNDPMTFLGLFKSDAPFNAGRWRSPHYDALLQESAQLTTSSARFAKLQEAEALLLAEMPFLPLFFMNWSALVHPMVQGYSDNVLDYHPYSAMSLEFAGD